jgi:hypothetical protein
MKYIGLISSDARGKNGGNVASRNRFGTYLRRHVAPVQPRSSSQLANRQTFGAISGAWRALTAAQQQGWNTLATTVTFKNSMGQTYNPTGAQLFMLFSRNLVLNGGSSYADAPTTLPSIPSLTSITPQVVYGFSTTAVELGSGGSGFPDTGTFTVTWSTGLTAGGTYTPTTGTITALTLTTFGSGQTGTATFAFSGGGTGATATATLGTVPTPEIRLAFAPTPVPTGTALFVYASKALSPGITFSSKSQGRFLQAVAAAGTSPADLHVAYGNVFGQLPSTGKIRFRAHLIDTATGYPGPDQVQEVTWTYSPS